MELQNWEFGELDISSESILRSQGADPALIKERRPDLVIRAEHALQEGRDLLEPAFFLKEILTGDAGTHSSVIDVS